MTTLLKKMALYLGLAPDDEFEEYDDDVDERAAPARQAASTGAPVRSVSTAQPRQQPAQTAQDSPPSVTAVRPIPVPSADSGSGSVTSTVRPVQRPAAPAIARPSIVAPESFSDAQMVADRFKMNQPVAMNLHDVDRQLSRRLIDFAAGLCYGLSGRIDRLSTYVFLLIPENVEVPQEERRRLAKLGE